MDQRRDEEAQACKIGSEAPPGNIEGGLINLFGPDFQGEHRFELYNRKSRDQGSRILLFKDTVHVIGAGLLVVEFRQRAGVQKIVRHLALLPESDNGLGKRTRDGGQGASHFIQRDIVQSRFRPFFRREVSGNVLAVGRGVGNRHSYLLPLFKR